MPVKIVCVVGTRPNFVKIAPLLRAFRSMQGFHVTLIHTGQHYEANLSERFFEDLEIPRPDLSLEVGSASHAAQTAEIIKRFEPVLEKEQPRAVLVVGDVNSTFACALVAAKYQLHTEFAWRFGRRRRAVVIHVEAGLRSFDSNMPEEINRRLTDAISDVLFVSEPTGLLNLEAEGVSSDKVYFVGNVMIDTLLALRRRAMASEILGHLGLKARKFGLLTLHRPANVDDPAALRSLLNVLDEVAAKLPLVFPVHPRTRKQMQGIGLKLDQRRWTLTDPVGYLDFVKLEASARVVLTDSGGVQEETTILGIPCVTLRENTERPVTISHGTNSLGGMSRESILDAFSHSLNPQKRRRPRYWDGKSAFRIVRILRRLFVGH